MCVCECIWHVRVLQRLHPIFYASMHYVELRMKRIYFCNKYTFVRRVNK